MDRLEICGNIASGKTTLAKAFENQLKYDVVYEDFTSVKCLSDFYEDFNKYAFETESIFTLLHYYQLKKKRSGFFVTDFSIINDYAFALTTLTKAEFEIYEKTFDYVLKCIGYPQRVIYLASNTDILFKRIGERGRKNEQGISKIYLGQIEKNINLALEKKFPNTRIVLLDSEMTTCDNYNKKFLMNLLQ